MKRFNIVVAIVSLLVDTAMIGLGLILAYKLRSGGADLYQWPFSSYLRFTAWILPIWLILMASQGLYNIRNAPRGWNAVPKILIGLLGGWAAMIIALYLWRTPESFVLPRLLIVYGFFLTVLFTLIGRLFLQAVIRLLYFSNIGLIKTLVIVNDGKREFVGELSANHRHGRQMVGTLMADDIPEGLKAFNRMNLDEVIVAAADLPEAKMLDVLGWTEASNINFALVPSLLSVRATNVETSTLAGTPVMFFRRTPLEGWGRVYKRLLDLIIVVPAMILLSPLLLLLFILAQLSTSSGIIRQSRIGQDGKVFYIHKFRSMYVDGDKRFPRFKGWSSDEVKDPRITPVGRLLRKTNLDELAQLWDILIGTMSLVGPRPEQPRYVEQFAKEFPDYIRRHRVKSGLTGWAQVNGARGNTPIAERVKYDLYYIENWSIWFDLRIIIATFVYIFRQLGRKDS